MCIACISMVEIRCRRARAYERYRLSNESCQKTDKKKVSADYKHKPNRKGSPILSQHLRLTDDIRLFHHSNLCAVIFSLTCAQFHHLVSPVFCLYIEFRCPSSLQGERCIAMRSCLLWVNVPRYASCTRPFRSISRCWVLTSFKVI